MEIEVIAVVKLCSLGRHLKHQPPMTLPLAPTHVLQRGYTISGNNFKLPNKRQRKTNHLQILMLSLMHENEGDV